MNERIKELREQAADFAEEAYDKQTMATFDTNKSAQELFEEKFAELIVRECAGIYSKIDNGNAHLGTEDYLEALQKHFGVE